MYHLVIYLSSIHFGWMDMYSGKNMGVFLGLEEGWRTGINHFGRAAEWLRLTPCECSGSHTPRSQETYFWKVHPLTDS